MSRRMSVIALCSKVVALASPEPEWFSIQLWTRGEGSSSSYIRTDKEESTGTVRRRRPSEVAVFPPSPPPTREAIEFNSSCVIETLPSSSILLPYTNIPSGCGLKWGSEHCELLYPTMKVKSRLRWGDLCLKRRRDEKHIVAVRYEDQNNIMKSVRPIMSVGRDVNF